RPAAPGCRQQSPLPVVLPHGEQPGSADQTARAYAMLRSLFVPSATGEPSAALRLRRRVVELVVVVEIRLVPSRQLVALQLEVRSGLDVSLRHRYLQVVGSDRDPAQRDEGQVA